MADLSGYSLGRYRVTEKLGEGGMATVYKAHDTHLERDVAIKLIRKDTFPADQINQILKRFEREAKSLAKLSHPNIVGVIDYGDYEGSPYLVMEYLPSGTVKEHLGKPIPWQDAAYLLLPIARALQFAHGQGIVHRDIKPSNILITLSGEPMLADFGLAKIMENSEAASLTGTGLGVGTPEYMAPEQWMGKPTPQSDIYSLGVVFYEMITGTKPYIADTPAAIFLKQSIEPLPRPISLIPDLPEDVEKIILKSLASKPENRFPTMAAFASGLDKILAGQSVQSQFSDQKEAISPRISIKEDTQVTVVQEDLKSQTKMGNESVEQSANSFEPPSLPSGVSSSLRWVLGVFLIVLSLVVSVTIGVGIIALLRIISF